MCSEWKKNQKNNINFNDVNVVAGADGRGKYTQYTHFQQASSN